MTWVTEEQLESKTIYHHHALDSAEGQCHEISIMSRAMLILTNTGGNGGIGIIV